MKEQFELFGPIGWPVDDRTPNAPVRTTSTGRLPREKGEEFMRAYGTSEQTAHKALGVIYTDFAMLEERALARMESDCYGLRNDPYCAGLKTIYQELHNKTPTPVADAEATVEQLVEHYRLTTGEEPTVIIVGKNVSSETLLALRRIEGLEIRQELGEPRVNPVGYARNPSGKGPRNKWGKLK